MEEDHDSGVVLVPESEERMVIRLTISDLGKMEETAEGLNAEPVPFSGGRTTTSFPLVDYLATNPLPRKRERLRAKAQGL